jgi:hypothetical protein
VIGQAAAAILIVALGGCSSFEPMEIKDAKELNKGDRGLFSGEDGTFTIFSK